MSDDLVCLLQDFIDARIFGTDKYCLKSNHDNRYDYLHNLHLNWKPTRPRNVQLNLNAINEFDRWQAVYHGTPRINQSEQRFLSTYEVYREWQCRTDWDPFMHLFNARQHMKEMHKTDLPAYLKDTESEKRRRHKSFPMNLFVRLVECCTNPRDKMLVLLQAGASLRRAEPLHILDRDIEGIDELGQTKVRLEDPLSGWVEWKRGGKDVSGTRKDFFKECYRNEFLSAGHPLRNLMPRPCYGQRNQHLHCGFKGMTFSDSDSESRFFRAFCDEGMECRAPFQGSKEMLTGLADNRPYDVFNAFWIDPKVGGYFQQCYEDYKNQYIYKNPFTGQPNPKGWPWHPWLFINIEKPGTYGYPLSYTAETAIWERLKARLIKSFAEGPERDAVEMTLCGLGWHSLRHFYGFYCANVLGLNVDIVQVLMHHAQISSTQVYYTLSNSTVKRALLGAALNNRGIDMDTESIILPDKPRLLFPDHWSNRYQSYLLTYKERQSCGNN